MWTIRAGYLMAAAPAGLVRTLEQVSWIATIVRTAWTTCTSWTVRSFQPVAELTLPLQSRPTHCALQTRYCRNCRTLGHVTLLPARTENGSERFLWKSFRPEWHYGPRATEAVLR